MFVKTKQYRKQKFYIRKVQVLIITKEISQ